MADPSGRDRATPLGDDEAALLFDEAFEGERHVVLAVSGGADSTALMHLAAAWRKSRGTAPPTLSVVTVDHGLRAGSTEDAEHVARAAKSLGLACTVLAWDGAKPASGIQEAARRARYELIAALLRANQWSTVATAHTETDQAETLLMRLARGSGLDGLAAMPVVSQRGDMRIVRPLLAIPKARLVATLEQRGVRWLDDPSNEQSRFERVRWRQVADELAGLGLTTAALARSSRRLGRARAALDARASAVIADGGVVRLDQLGWAEIDWPALCRHPDEIRFRVLIRTLRAVGGADEPVSLEALEAMTEGRSWASPAGRTIARVVFESGPVGRIALTREFGREPLPKSELQPGRSLVWDGRFVLRLEDDAPLTIAPLGQQGLRQVDRAMLPEHVPRRALWSLPAVWQGGDVCAVPALQADQRASVSCQFIGWTMSGSRDAG